MKRTLLFCSIALISCNLAYAQSSDHYINNFFHLKDKNLLLNLQKTDDTYISMADALSLNPLQTQQLNEFYNKNKTANRYPTTKNHNSNNYDLNTNFTNLVNNVHNDTLYGSNLNYGKPQNVPLRNLLDPLTKTFIPQSYPVEVDSFLTLEQAQMVLSQVSPKLAADQAAITASQYQSDATKTLSSPLVFAKASINAYHLNKDIDISEAKTNFANGINQLGNHLLSNIPLPNTMIPPNPALNNLGDTFTANMPDDYEINHSGHNSNVGIGVIVPVYTAGRTQAITGIFDARTDEAKADAELNANDLYTTLIQRYFNAQLAIIGSYLRDDAVATLQKTDYTAQRLYEEGFISKVERLEAQSALADAKSEAVKAQNDARLAMMALQRLLRTPYRIKPTTPLFISSKPLPSLEYFQNLALTHNPALQKVAAKREQADRLRSLSDTGLKPTISVYGYGQIDKKPNWLAGVSATWKLWGGIDNKSSVNASIAKIRQAELSNIEINDNLLLLVEKNWHAVNNAQARYQSLQSNIKLAKELLRFRQLGLQEGINTALDVVQAQTQYLKIRTQQTQAANDYVQSLASLMQSCGTPFAFNEYLQTADIRLPTLYSKGMVQPPVLDKTLLEGTLANQTILDEPTPEQPTLRKIDYVQPSQTSLQQVPVSHKTSTKRKLNYQPKIAPDFNIVFAQNTIN